MRFGEAIDEERLVSLLRPADGIATVLTADVYGEGEADRLLSIFTREGGKELALELEEKGYDWVRQEFGAGAQS